MTRRRGYSLIELLTALIIGGIISGVVITTLLSQIQLSATQNRNIMNQQNLRGSLEYICDEIRSAGAGVDEPIIDVAAADQIRFIADIDGNPANWERVQYTYDAANDRVQRQLWQSTDQGGSWTSISTDDVLTGVSAAAFTYFALNDNNAAAVADITSVAITITQDQGFEATAVTEGKIAAGAMSARATIRNRVN